jgi:hypothetical protein
MFVALAAPLTDATAIRLPTDADAFADLAILHFAAYLCDGPDNLVARDEGIFTDAPVVVDQVDIAMTDAAMRDFDLNVIGRKLFDPVLVRQ